MLILTIHDVAPPHVDAVRRLRDAAASWGVSAATLLAVPDHHGRAPLAASPETVGWLGARLAAGDEVALHGITHRQDAPAARWLDRARARLFTAGEGEMLGAGAADPWRLLVARTRLQRLLGAHIGGFVAPAWLEPRGFDAVLAGIGFAWRETGLVLQRLPERARLAPAIGFATRSPWRELASRAWAHLLTPVTSRRGWVRIALHPADLTSPAVMRLAERLVRRLTAQHASVTTSTALGL